MRNKDFLRILLVFGFCLSLISCKKDKVDGSSPQAFQSSINDMASELSTLQQIKFNEALYILKKFAVSGDDDLVELQQLSKLLEGKNVQQILALADATAMKNGLDWKSTGQPSLGMTNIFTSIQPQAHDPNDIPAKKIALEIQAIGGADSSLAEGLSIVPVLTDDQGNPVNFSNAGLDATMEVYSGGIRILTSKNIMQSSGFKGFTLRYSSLAVAKIINNAIDIRVTVSTSKRKIQMMRAGISVNPTALKQPVVTVPSDSVTVVKDSVKSATVVTPATVPAAKADPKATVSRFLSNLNAQNLKKAYEEAQNPAWGSYDRFANPSSGFGAVKSVKLNSIKAEPIVDDKTKVKASYTVTDKNGATTTVNAVFGMTQKNGKWIITSYQLQ